MHLRVKLVFTILSITAAVASAQTGTVSGYLTGDGQPVAYAQLYIDALSLGTTTDAEGYYTLHDIPVGTYDLTATYLGYEDQTTEINISENGPSKALSINLKPSKFQIDEVVVTGTKTFKRQSSSPIIVNVVDSKTLDNVQACNLSEGLKFQPGLRVETDCQTCNYTQLRMNGLAGGYSQILINGRPIFSPLTGLYGLEQLPANMIDKIEVVRGGGSSLYGSSAIGGTVNVLTKIPTDNSYELDYTYQNIEGQTGDNILSGNATLVSEGGRSGISFFMNHRNRGFYDANEDNFSEIPLLRNTSLGTNFFFLPNDNQKLEFSLSNINEYRLGGEMRTDIPAHLTLQSEERNTSVWLGSADYQINFNHGNSSLISYAAWQNTDRTHYTGIQPDEGTEAFESFIANPPYGTSDVSTYNVGVQLNHALKSFIFGENILTLGTEYVYDSVLDDIPAYNYLIDQTTKNLGVFVQSDWELLPQLNILSGVRMDKHNLLDKVLFSPRASLLYKLGATTQFRVNYGTGFRAPQAFDTDLHIAFAGGGISRVALSPDLIEENSKSYSASINYDKVTEDWVAGFTLEGFHNRLEKAFVLQPVGEDAFGELFEKQNGEGATVQGVTLELRANYNRKIQLESGFTLQTSQFDSPVQYIDELEGIREFVRTPNDYGYAILTLTPNKQWNATLNYIYTGTMKVPHFAGAPNQLRDEIITTETFSELSLRLAYNLKLEKLGNNLELYGGIRNIFNDYQNDFDIGKNRDSNFVYGPAQPRTFYLGLKVRS